MFDFGNSQNHWFYWHTRELLRKICFSLNGIYEKFCKNQPTFANYTLISPPIWEPFLFYIGRGNFEGHLWLPYYIKRLFYNGFRAKVKWRYEGRRFSTPPEPLLDGRNIGNSVLLWYLVKSIYDRGKNFFSIFFAFLVQKIHQQISLSLMFSMFLILYYEKNTYFYTSDYIKECNVCQQFFAIFT